jgi:cytochrome c oxidase subunit 3
MESPGAMSKPYSEKNYLIHPSAMMIILVFMGIATLFGALSMAYLYTRVDLKMHSVRIPPLFIFNSLVVLFSSYSIQRCRIFFTEHDDRNCIRWGLITIFSTLGFLCLQGMAWYQLFTRNIFPESSAGYGFLFAISILHFLHVMAGLPFFGRVIFPLMAASRQGSSTLVFMDDQQKRRLKYTSWYWHFIDVVWLYLVAFFLINSIW